MASPATAPDAATTPPTSISLRAPSPYLSDKTKPTTTDDSIFVSPPLDWLYRTWSVTHSTLPMWRSARNVRITYKPLDAPDAAAQLDDHVQYEKASNGAYKEVRGIDKQDPTTPGAWNWRGRGWLRIASSHWEVLGWGERPLADGTGVERWAVTWFAKTLFTPEGVDVYSDRPEGLTEPTQETIMAALRSLQDAPAVVQSVEKDMKPVEIKLPWNEGR